MTDHDMPHDEGVQHLYHVGHREAGGAVEALAQAGIVDETYMLAMFQACFLTGAEFALRCARARPDKVGPFLDEMDRLISDGDGAASEQREAEFVGERPYLFGEEETL